MLSLFPNLQEGVLGAIFIPLAFKAFIQSNRVFLFDVISWHFVLYSLLIAILIELIFVKTSVFDNIDIPADQIFPIA
jgi:hypothetical protein